MPQSFCQIYIHAIFSTKGRRRWLDDGIRSRVLRAFLKRYEIPYDERYVWD